jgi:hypothetical protein
MEKHIANVIGCRESAGEIALRKTRWEQKTKCQRSNLSRTNSREILKHTRLKEAIKDRIRGVNDNRLEENQGSLIATS